MAWLRLYTDILDDRRFFDMPAELYRRWSFLLVVCKKHDGRLPPLSDCAWSLRLSDADMAATLEELSRLGLIDSTDTGLCPHNWDGRQFESDNSVERVRRYRERMRSNGDTIGGYLKHKGRIFERDGDACVYCGSADNLVIDHLIPVSRGGDSEPDNLVTACKSCNSGKSGRLL